MKRIIAAAVLALLAGCASVKANDIPIFPSGPVYTVSSGLVWGTSGSTGFNNNFFFTPLTLNESVCVYVYNNNPTSSHLFTAGIFVTGNPSETTPSDGAWQSTANSSGILAGVSPSQPGGIGGLVSGASQVSVNLSASTTQAGSPDTAKVVIAQSPNGNCFAGNQMISSSPSTFSAVPPIQAVSDGLSQSFTSGLPTLTNPANAAVTAHINVNNGNRTLYLDKAIISCSAACAINFAFTNTVGTTCTTVTPVNLKSQSSVTSTSVNNESCTTPPAVITTGNTILIPAASAFTVDLKGVILTAGSTNGFAIQMNAALTGTITTNFFWYEK